MYTYFIAAKSLHRRNKQILTMTNYNIFISVVSILRSSGFTLPTVMFVAQLVTRHHSRDGLPYCNV